MGFGIFIACRVGFGRIGGIAFVKLNKIILGFRYVLRYSFNITAAACEFFEEVFLLVVRYHGSLAA